MFVIDIALDMIQIVNVNVKGFVSFRTILVNTARIANNLLKLL